MLSYFQLLYDFFINLNYFTLHYLRLFMVIFNYFWFFLLFHPKLLLVLYVTLAILAYFTLGYFQLL
jgi:hypothetical protein